MSQEDQKGHHDYYFKGLNFLKFASFFKNDLMSSNKYFPKSKKKKSIVQW